MIHRKDTRYSGTETGRKIAQSWTSGGEAGVYAF